MRIAVLRATHEAAGSMRLTLSTGYRLAASSNVLAKDKGGLVAAIFVTVTIWRASGLLLVAPTLGGKVYMLIVSSY
jgi:hypothetical protein